MAALRPDEVEKWLRGLGSLLPREAVQALAEEVRRQGMDGEGFDALVASRAMPALGDALRPSHMATLRRCWNASRGPCSQQKPLPPAPQRAAQAGARSSSAQPHFAPPARATAAALGSGAAPRCAGAGEARRPELTPNPPPQEPLLRAEAAAAGIDAARHAGATTPPRTSEQSFGALAALEPEPLALAAGAPAKARSQSVPRTSGSRETAPPPGPSRPPQVPRLDLASIHRNATSRGDAGQLNSRHWVDPAAKAGAQPQRPAQEDVGAKGFASASPEDQQRIAEYYGFRDEGFATAMHGLRTDQIRPRLYVGTMADAAYWPHLKSLNITHVVNCAVEAQKAPPPYESHGITYHILPLHDSPEEVQQLVRQRFRSLRQATRFVRDALRQRAGSVLLHCVQGMSRSAALACAYLMECEDVSMERAIAEVQAKHRGCLASPHWQSLLVKLNTELLKGV